MYADAVAVLDRGRLVASGDPVTVLDSDLLRAVFGVDGGYVPDPFTGLPVAAAVARGIQYDHWDRAESLPENRRRRLPHALGRADSGHSAEWNLDLRAHPPVRGSNTPRRSPS